GFAYKINPKTVFRGAYGILYGVSVLQAAGVSGSSGTEGFRGSTNFTASVDGGGVPFATMSNPFPLGLNLPLGAKEGPTSGALTNIGAGLARASSMTGLHRWGSNGTAPSSGSCPADGS